MRLIVLLSAMTLIGCNDQVRPRGIAGNMQSNDGPLDSTAPKKSVSPKTKHERCQSTRRCFYASMPIYAQSDQRLENYVGSKIGVSNYQDTGMCVPVSAAMLLEAVLDERDPDTRLNNAFLERAQEIPWYESVYKIGVDSGTRFIEGGTYIADTSSAFSDYFRYTSSAKGLRYHRLGLGQTRANITSAALIKLIQERKYGYVVGVDRNFPVTQSGKTWYEFQGSHALAIKGHDGDRLHLQDPWGMDHFARLQNEEISFYEGAAAEKSTILSPIGTGGFGFMYYYQGDKFVIDELLGISLD